MNENDITKEVPSTAADPDATSRPSPDPEHRPGSPTRRELIERCGKVAMTSAPLLLFVAHQRQIKSKP